ncbi:DUF3099 domain-containing protein [Paenarthrobacter nitroguajacolicus]|uniref:DUF3099 domain-containing protein n=1 Tax=Paenarthrobacter nitroguajacolicus TaxID=211146 RepID=A0A558HB41_PAENT|nr:DUF3099 domain-containing protein [Paenarthrobacter nitroguajacolicus]TVU66356.1 DUF3099 domain-containing protein [Paenarthrobacter nitroguajacolicus]
MERDDSAVTPESSPLQQVPGEPDAVSSDPEVHSITDAAAAHSEDMRERMIKYAVAMGIRMVCIILIFVVDGWFKIIAIAGAVFLPWIAVVIANGNDKAEDHSESLLDYVAVPEIEGSAQPDDDERAEAPTVLQGELVDDEPTGNQADPTKGHASEAGHAGDERAAS